jgi:amino acid adenylation domain-containing protein
VEQAQRELIGLLAHEQASLSLARSCSGIAGSAPLFCTLLNFRHSGSKSEADWGDVPGIHVVSYRERTNYPITVSVDDQDEQFLITVQADRRIDASRLTRYVEAAMESLVFNLEHAPQALAITTPIIPRAEAHQLIWSFNDSGVGCPIGFVHELFEKEVKSRPEAMAVVYEDRRLTYRQLNRAANQLARSLVGLGVVPDRCVGVFVERGFDLVVSLLGILKAGGTYLPLDTAAPAERLMCMLEDAMPLVVLAESRLSSLLPITSANIIELDDRRKEVGEGDDANLDPCSLGLTANSLAYVLYTSGSTGQPKGVASQHGGMINRIAAQEAIEPFSADDVGCQKTSIGFVDSIFEILGPLCYGRPLVIVPSVVAKDAQQLASFIERERITRLITVPSLAQAMLEDIQAADHLNGLRSWTLSGEELKAPLLRKLQQALPSCSFINIYGSTEVTADATYYVSRRFEGDQVPIGRPIANTQVYVLNSQLNPVPIGVRGEIYVGGAGVARGYLNRPELTAERFIADPFNVAPGQRLYKTGDLGRWRADGSVEYLGRNDHQVKIRGFRIELGEIEAQLARYERVKEVVVVAREDIPGEKRLVAYVVPQEGVDGELSVEDIRGYLRSLLPEYMVPSAIVALDHLPLTSNGKLDRRALPLPPLEAFSSRQYEAPQGEVEEVLAAIWQELLGVQRVGRHDNFFELGGHSLHAVKLIVLAEARLGVTLRAIAIFEFPTVKDMSEAVVTLRLHNPRSAVGVEVGIESGVI